MDERQTNLLEEIRDAIRENSAALAIERQQAEAFRAEAMEVTRAHQRFYKRVVVACALLVVLLLLFLFSMASR